MEIICNEWNGSCRHVYKPIWFTRLIWFINPILIFRDVVARMDNNTMLFVIGDHGMTGTGNASLIFPNVICFNSLNDQSSMSAAMHSSVRWLNLLKVTVCLEV